MIMSYWKTGSDFPDNEPFKALLFDHADEVFVTDVIISDDTLYYHNNRLKCYCEIIAWRNWE